MTSRPDEKRSERDLRLDLFRGLANWAIFLDHVPNNLIAWVTVRNYGFSDAAELFVFVSGFTVAFVYARVMQARGFLAAAIGILARVWKIYVAYVLLFVIYVVAIGYMAQRFGHAHLLDEFNIRRLIADPIQFLKHGLMLEYRPLNLDVLPLYIALMTPFPAVLWLLTKAPHATLLASFILYVAARAFDWNVAGYPSGVWYFNPFAWQLLFVIGAWMALVPKPPLHRVLRSPVVMPIALAILVFSAIVTLAIHAGFEARLPDAIQAAFVPNDKTNLAPYRIVHFLALAVVIWRLVPQDMPMLKHPILRPMIVSGEHSLEVFCAGVFLAFVAHFVTDLTSNSFVVQLMVSIGGIALMIGLAYFLRWVKAAGSRTAIRAAAKADLASSPSKSPQA